MAFLIPIQINSILSILLMILLGHAYFNMNRKKITNRLFMWITGLTLFTSILEILSILLNNPNLKQLIVLNKLVNLFGFIVTPMIPFLGYLFMIEWINRYQKEKIKINYILILPLFINAIGALMSFTGSGSFHITNENTYERGPLFFILPCVSYLYLGYNLYFIYKHRKNLSYTELIIFNLFFIAPAAFTIIQLKSPAFLTTWNSTAIIIVITYIFILNDQVYRDSLTGLGNRLSYEHYIQTITHKKLQTLFIVYIDIDDFKAINDEYGHNEGDRAIIAFANLLAFSFPLRNKKLIRLGGDEFLILLEEQEREKVETYILNLTQNFNSYNNREEKPYQLKFSYGLARYTDGYENIHQLLEYSDQLMYEQKQTRKSKI